MLPCRPTACLVLIAIVGQAAAQQAQRTPQPAQPDRVFTSMGARTLIIDSPLAKESPATIQDLAPGKPSQAAEQLTLTSRVILKADADVAADLQATGYTLTGAPAGYVTIDTPNIRAASTLTTTLLNTQGVTHASVEARTEMTSRTPLNDEFYGSAWHLFNEDQEGNDVNAEAAWALGYTGKGVNIGIIDQGIWGFHPDLAPQRNNTAGQTGSSSFHGTAVAGVACAIGNNEQGAAGLAYDSTHSQLFYSPSGNPVVNATAFAHRNDLNDIKNNSWGPADTGTLKSIAQVELDALADSVNNGRGGKGTIHTWASGNGGANDRVEYDPYAASPHTISIGAIGNQASHAAYSERGSSLFAVTYSDGNGRNIVTTSNSSAQPYTFNFGGTSSACPLASGAIALCLEANPDLTWRDAQHLVVNTAKPVDTDNSNWTTNAAGHDINYSYGFGQLDAELMVQAAENWQTVPPIYHYDAGSISPTLSIPDNDPAGVSVAIDVPDDMIIEHVAIDVEANGSYIGDLLITLTSPGGTDSVIHTNHNNSADDIDHTFYSVRHWDERAKGQWTLTVADLVDSDTHTLTGFALRFIGTEINCPADQDDDSQLTTDDFLAWMTNYTKGEMRADMNNNGSLEPTDFTAWIAAYNEGCGF